jgi:DNA-binding transcriptional MerR regulator
VEQDALINVADIARLFRVSGQTVRQWSIEFAEHLSPTANPGRNRTRNYTEDDLAVFALIAEMKARGRVYHDIHTALSIGQRGEIPSPETIQRRNRFEEELLKLQSATDHELALANQRLEQTQQQLEHAQADRDYWRTQATTAQEKLETINSELYTARIEGARLSGEMEGLRRERDGLATVDQRYQAQLQRLESQVERLQTRIDSLEDERARLTQELMSVYRRRAGTAEAGPEGADGDATPGANSR